MNKNILEFKNEKYTSIKTWYTIKNKTSIYLMLTKYKTKKI